MSQTVTAQSRHKRPVSPPEPLLGALVTDDQAFDEHLVRSALAYVNGTLGLGSSAAEPDEALAWVPKVMIERYRLTKGIGAKPLRPSAWQQSDRIKAQLAIAFMVNGLTRWRAERTTGKPAPGHASAFDWVNSMLLGLPMLSFWQVGQSGLTTHTLPQLDSAERCVAYAVACVAGDRWGMGDRLDICAFVPSADSRPHLFLADNLKQKFCCPAHANAQRQREFKQAVRKHK